MGYSWYFFINATSQQSRFEDFCIPEEASAESTGDKKRSWGHPCLRGPTLWKNELLLYRCMQLTALHGIRAAEDSQTFNVLKLLASQHMPNFILFIWDYCNLRVLHVMDLVDEKGGCALLGTRYI